MPPPLYLGDPLPCHISINSETWQGVYSSVLNAISEVSRFLDAWKGGKGRICPLQPILKIASLPANKKILKLCRASSVMYQMPETRFRDFWMPGRGGNRRGCAPVTLGWRSHPFPHIYNRETWQGINTRTEVA